ncbi:MAG: lantibiotic dehydratase family protein [Candidatus Limimorpha sp.]
MGDNIPYKSFERYIFRAAHSPIDEIRKLMSEDVVFRKDLRKLSTNPSIKEALFIASPSFYHEVQKWTEGELPNIKEDEKVMHGLLRYFSRMCTRCTPFGMFAGISVGEMADDTEMAMSPEKTNMLHVRLDMNYICALAKDIAEIHSIKNKILFYPNDSIYKIGDKTRYVEYGFVKARRSHHISAVDATDYLQKVLDESRQGKRLDDLAGLLVDDEVTFDDARDFIDEMVAAQLLISELEPTVIGTSPLEQMIDVLCKCDDETAKSIRAKLEEIRHLLQKLGGFSENEAENARRLKIYEEIKAILDTFPTKYDEKFLYQADMLQKPMKNTMSRAVAEEMFKTAEFLNSLTPAFENENLKNFREAFYSRYEDEEVPLAQALDTESGVGYLQNTYSGITPLVDDIAFPVKMQNYQNYRMSSIDAVMQRKLSDALQDGKNEIQLEKSDFEGPGAKWDDTQETISAFIQLFENGHYYVHPIGGSCAANLIGRFCHLDPSLLNHTMEIIEKDEADDSCIYAEIVHLPESRIGNILHRPSIREYEIPYLARSSKPLENQIGLDDLMVSVRGESIVLRSKKHNKIVVPRLTTAHNFSQNSLPVYHFLCDMQNYGKRGGFGFSWGAIGNTMPYLPRVTFGNAILSLQTWNFSRKDIESLNKTKDIEERVNLFAEVASNRKMVDEVALEDGDNELYINIKNRTSIKILLDLVKNRMGFTLKEFLFGIYSSPVKSENGTYANEILISYYKDHEKGGEP